MSGLQLLFDIETNGFLEKLDTIHCIAIRDLSCDKTFLYRDGEIETALEHLMDADLLVGHHICGFDIPALQKVYPHFKPKARLRDTLIMSRLVFADLKERDFKARKKIKLPGYLIGSHGLEAWGHRLGFHKGDYAAEMKAKGLDPWAAYSEAMGEYCVNDVDLNVALWKRLLSKKFSDTSIQLEHDVRAICDQQEAFGCPFDEEAAVELYRKLSVRRTELEDSLRDSFGGWWVGTPFTPKRSNSTLGYVEDRELTKLEWVEFNPASRDHIARCLKVHYGWQPKVFTPSGKPQVDESTLKGLPFPEADVLNEYLMLQKRIGQLAEGKEAWLKLVKEGRIHGRIHTNGAVTGRATHSKPNLAQVPASRAPYGHECRSLFRASPGMVMVGADASGLELRCLAHYLAHYDGGAYGDIVLNGDIHTANQQAAGLKTRDQAKTFIYALLYGAGEGKLGEIVRKGPRAGRALRDRFMAAIPAYAKLIKGVKKAAKERERLKSLDGRYLYTRSEHSALNTLLQGAGAVIMKQAMVNFHALAADAGHGHGHAYRQLLWVHDEFQIECYPDIADTLGGLMVEAIRMVTDQFNLMCPLDGEYKVGRTWAETH